MNNNNNAPAPSAPAIIAGCLLSLLGGAALLLAMPRFGGCWPLVFVALVPMLFAQYRLLPRRLSGLAPGLTIGTHWLVALYQLNSIVGLPGILLAGLLASLFFALLFSPGRAFNERSGYALIMLELPALWVAIDVLRGHSAYLGSSGWLAYDLAAVPALIQPVSLLGTPALSFLILAVNVALGLGLLAWYDRRHPPRAGVAVSPALARRTLVATTAAALIWAGLSLWLDAQASSGPKVRVAIAQPGTDTPPGDMGATRLARLTRSAARQGAQIVIWPEDVLTFDPTSPTQDFVARLARATHTYLLTGYTLDSGKHSNQSALFSPAGQFIGRFHKNHPVILMGEDWDFPRSYPVWPTPLGSIGPLICFDLSFPADSAREAAGGAQLLLIPSFGPASTASDQYHIAQFRAAENRVALVKGDWAWASAIIDPHGRVLAHTESLDPAGEQGLLVADVPLGDGKGSFFSRYGSGFDAIFYGLVLLRIALQLWFSWSRQRQADPR